MNEESNKAQREPIAIVGMGCRLPGANSPSEFWRLLIEGSSAIREIPQERMDVAALFDPTPANPGHIMTKWAGVLDRIDYFDAQFFGIAPREAELVDPQQRLLLEVSWEALEDAGIPASGLNESNTGVFVGLWLNEYENRMFRDLAGIEFYRTLGTGRYSASGRLSYFYGLQGPSITVDTACSSSLVAVHLACKSLSSGECGLAIAGGANTILEPFITIAYSQSKMMAPDGRCKFGDARADGYVRSDGAAVVVLKRLSDAEAAGDPIYALIRGGAVNNDGRGSGFLATPAKDGQVDLLRKAYRDARVSPGIAQYVEAHGTGTLAGDPVEIQALGEVLADGRRPGSVCRLGSVKTNIGHTESAAGVVGLMKVALALKYGTIPRSLNFSEPNPRIPWHALPVMIQGEPSSWPDGRHDAVAGVSAFGIAGTNAHMVLQAHHGPRPRLGAQIEASADTRVLLLSAHSNDALIAAAGRWAEFIAASSDASFDDICYTAALRRSHQDHRLAVVVRTREEAADALQAFASGESHAAVVSGFRVDGQRRPVFVFPGQGSQWLGMGRRLMADEPAFADAMRRCDGAIRALTGWSVVDELGADEQHSRLEEIQIVQPVLFSIQISLAALWRSWGIEPHAVVGHSMGEIAAAHVAGALSLEDAARIICTRSGLLRQTSGKGAMAVVELSLDAARAALVGREHLLSIAVSNSPQSTVIAGDTQALDTLLAELEAREVFCRRIKVNVASHSPQMDPLRADLLAALQGLSPRAAACPFLSTVMAKQVDGRDLDASYWVRNLREPVLFSTVIQQLIAEGFDIFIEMSSHPLLVGAMQEMLRDAGGHGLAVESCRRDSHEASVMRASLATLHLAGVEVDWARFYPARGQVVPTPLYPWQRERYWFDAPAVSRSAKRSSDLLGDAFHPALSRDTFLWEFELSTETLPTLADHRVRTAVVVPAAMMVSLALEAGRRALARDVSAVEDVAIPSALVLPDSGTCSVQIQVAIEATGVGSFVLCSRTSNASAWARNATATLRTEPYATQSAEPRAPRRSAEPILERDIYARMRERALEYGPAYQRIAEAWRDEDALVARIRPIPPPSGIGSQIQARSTLLDACFQAVLASISTDTISGQADTYVPTALKRVRVLAPMQADVDVFCRVSSRRDGSTISGDLMLLDAEGRILLQAEGLRMICLERAVDRLVRVAHHRLEWVPAPPLKRGPAEGSSWIVVGRPSPRLRALIDAMHERGAHVVHVPDARAIAASIVGAAAPDVVCVSAGEEPDLALDPTLNALRTAQVLATLDHTRSGRLWLITARAQAALTTDTVSSLPGAAVWGLRATIAAEFPQLRCTAIDVQSLSDDALAIVDELVANGAETEVALRGGSRLVLRLRAGLPDHPAGSAAYPANGKPFRVTTITPGLLDGLGAEPMTRRAPAAHEVEIEIEAAGLNFMNVMSAMGAYPGYPKGLGPLGIECAGSVVRIGAAVREFAAGDAVIAFAHDSLATHAVADARLVARMPPGLRFEEAATLPIAYLTAYYALHHLGRMAAGERVLIHSATGGVGLAAIRLAQAAGAEIFATAGTEEKRALLRSMGVRCAADSRSTSFAEEIRAATDGEGVDLVLNSLTGNAIEAGIGLLRNGGRFIEIGKRDIYDNRSLGLFPFHRNLAYFAVDLDRMAREHAAALGPIFRECMAHLERAHLGSLPFQVFDVAHVADAFRHMAQGAHTGKIVIGIDRQSTPVRHPSSARPVEWTGVYLITGGTGALGLEVTEWLVAQGARDIVLVSRRGESEEAAARVGAWRAQGVTVTIARGDVSNEEDVRAVLASISDRSCVVSGIVHAAGVLDDALIAELDDRKLQNVFAPKVLGAWHLHRLTVGQPVQFFVMFSSVASFLGLAGQGNYAAANAWLDALAALRRGSGLPAISISWGPWSEVGLAAARHERGERLSARGLRGIPPAAAMEAFAALLERNPVHAVVMSFDFAAWAQAYPSALSAPLFTEFGRAGVPVSATTGCSLREQLLALPAGRSRHACMQHHLQQEIAHVLKLRAAKIDINRPFRALGLDSLMGLELRNRLESSTEVSVPATLIWNYPTVGQLAPQVAARMGIALDETADTELASVGAEERTQVDMLLQEIEGMSDEDVRRTLAKEA